MILLADENLDRSVVARLRADGHEVLAVAEMQPGIGDTAVLALAETRQALLLTEDKDFGELVFRQGLVHAGVILMRLSGLSATAKGAILSQALAKYGGHIEGAFTVLSPRSLRIRRRDL